MHTLAIVLALALTADAKAKDTKDTKAKDPAMGNMVKDAMAPSHSPDGGSADEGPDVSKMTFSKDAVAKIVSFHQPKIQSCYEETLAVKDKAVEGTLITSWTITAEGLVKGAKVEKKGTTLKDPRLHDCVVAVISAMNFPATNDKKAVPITYPFNLKAVH
jgi:hypothetical protein